MEFRERPELAEFRARARAWLAASLPPEWRRPGPRGPADPRERLAFAKRWQRRLHEGGFAGLAWPREFGGQGASPTRELVWNEEYARAGGPDLILLSVGTSLVGPVLIARGEPWQRERFLGPILAGEEIWCQGFSEPGAGSDLAALRTRGEVQGDEIVVTGQKIWTSFAQHADWCILVVRTDPAVARKHPGLSFLLVDMRSPGIEVRPLTEMTGENWFNEVFFDGVRVPIANVVGEIGGGWDIVVHTLSHERTSSAPHAKLEVELGWLRELARRTPRGDGAAADDPSVRQELARCAAECLALRALAWRNALAAERTGHAGPRGSLLKLGWSELDQRVKALAAQILGPRALLWEGDPEAPDAGHWSWALLWSRASTLYAGTSEVQRNIIAQRLLGLPRA
jgi:alkylation response protein AidB-like acyl-CoA dehydrogenase